MKTTTRWLVWLAVAIIIAGSSGLVIVRWHVVRSHASLPRLPAQDIEATQSGAPATQELSQRTPSEFPPKHDVVDQGPLFPVSDGSDKWGYINRRGHLVAPLSFSAAGVFLEDVNSKFAVVTVGGDGGKCGYVDRSGRVAIPVQYTFCGYFSEGLAAVQLDNHVGTNQMQVVNEHGDLVIPPRFDYVGDFVGGIAPARLYGERSCGYINTTGNWAIRPRFEYCAPFSEELAAVGFRPCGFIDRSGNVVIETQFERCGSFKGGVALVGRYAFWGRFLTGTSLGHFVLRRVPVDQGDMPVWSPTLFWGFVKRDGTWQLQPAFARLGPLSSGLALAGDEKKIGYLNVNGQFVIAPQFVQADTFRDGYASVLAGDPPGWTIIDASGKTVVRLQFPPSSNVVNFGDGIFRIDELVETSKRRNLKTTYIDEAGNMIWPKAH